MRESLINHPSQHRSMVVYTPTISVDEKYIECRVDQPDFDLCHVAS